MSATAGAADQARELAARADALRAQCESLGGAAQDDGTRATLARIAGRLSSSVVRPLAAALQ